MGERRIHLLRHGETTGGSSVRFFGRTDLPLSELGREQVGRHKPFLDGRPLRAVYTSRMLRARQSAEVLLEGRGLRPIAYDPFDEVDFGSLEGRTEEEIRLEMPDYWRVWRVEKKATCYPGGESFEAFRRRVFDGAVALERRGGLPSETLIVAHRGVIRHLLGYFLKVDTQESRALAPELGEWITLTNDGAGWRLEKG